MSSLELSIPPLLLPPSASCSPLLRQSLVRMADRPAVTRLVGRLTASLLDALGTRPIPDYEMAVLAGALDAAVDAWVLSVSGFMRLNDEVRGVLERLGAGAPQIERVLEDLESIFLELWMGDSPARMPR